MRFPKRIFEHINWDTLRHGIDKIKLVAFSYERRWIFYEVQLRYINKSVAVLFLFKNFDEISLLNSFREAVYTHGSRRFEHVAAVEGTLAGFGNDALR